VNVVTTSTKVVAGNVASTDCNLTVIFVAPIVSEYVVAGEEEFGYVYAKVLKGAVVTAESYS
jgi:hypothetical protein